MSGCVVRMGAASQVSSRTVTFLLNLVITRMLTPEAYGVRAVVMCCVITVHAANPARLTNSQRCGRKNTTGRDIASTSKRCTMGAFINGRLTRFRWGAGQRLHAV